jgi:hypothetical protein
MTSRGGWPRIDPVFHRRGKRPRARTPGPERPLPACVSLRRLSLRNPSAVFPDRPHGKAVMSGPPASTSIVGFAKNGALQNACIQEPLRLIFVPIHATRYSIQVNAKRLISVDLTVRRRRIRLVFRQTSSIQRRLPGETVDRNQSVPCLDLLSRKCSVLLAHAPWQEYMVHEWGVGLRGRGSFE